jgi:hypothetical protein
MYYLHQGVGQTDVIANKAPSITKPLHQPDSFNRGALRPKNVHHEAAPRPITQTARQLAQKTRIRDHIQIRLASVSRPAPIPPSEYNKHILEVPRDRQHYEGAYTFNNRNVRDKTFNEYYKMPTPENDIPPSDFFGELDRLEASGFDPIFIASMRSKLRAGALSTLTSAESMMYQQIMADILKKNAHPVAESKVIDDVKDPVSDSDDGGFETPD